MKEKNNIPAPVIDIESCSGYNNITSNSIPAKFYRIYGGIISYMLKYHPW